MMQARTLSAIARSVALGLLLAGGPALAGQVDDLRRGMHKADVEKLLGAPSERRGPVGEPPISSWVYDGFAVYFEHDLMLHLVNTNKACPLCTPREASKQGEP